MVTIELITAIFVEPDDRTQGRLRAALERRGFDVISTRSRVEASDLLDERAPHVFLYPERRGIYRVVWLADESRADVTIEATPRGWRRFDEALAS
jgi:hypothetical protein